MNLPAPVCVLIADSRRERFPLVTYQWVALRGMRCQYIDLATADFYAAGLGQRTLLAMSYPTLLSLDASELCALRNAVSNGATLYVRGGFSAGRCSLAPFASGDFLVEPAKRVGGYRLADHPLLPRVLRNETVEAAVELPAARIADATVSTLAARSGDGAENLPFIFAVPCGDGVVIHDLLADEVPVGAMTPIARRMADPAGRCFDLGALAAVNHASQRSADKVSAYNLVLDDRPRNFDYFNVSRVTRWLAQVEQACPGTHVDFAWTPEYNHPSTRYISALKRFNTGFVWHGLWRHVDHRRVEDPCADHQRGLRLVDEISRHYSVRFQPIMILPFQDVDVRMLLYLRDAGFSAAVFHGDPRPGIPNSLPAFMHYSTFWHDAYLDFLPVLRRYLAPELTRERLLANAALDLPIIAAAHPFEVGLRRFAGIYKPWEPLVLHFGEVLTFAREKGLRPLSLEEIAREMLDAPVPNREAADVAVAAEGLDIAL
jgi:hypothetical protein